MNPYIDLKNQTFSYVGRGGKQVGEFTFLGNTHLNSIIQGKITVEGDSLLTIEKFAEINGEIECHNLELFGVFSGEIHSSGKVVIHPTATVSGKIFAKNFSIFPGAVVNIDGETKS